jgi:NTE family protein
MTPPTPTLRDWLTEAPFTLTLSSGFFGFFAHTGVLSALTEEGLRPHRLSGSSAGALVSGLWASGLEIPELREALLTLRREDFWDPGLGLGLLKGELFDQKLSQLLNCQRFEDTRAPLQVTAFHCLRLRARVFDQGPLAPAIRASCSFPGLFQPVWINGAPYLDGGITDRPGLMGVPEGERVLYHHLQSRSHLRRRAGLTRHPRRPLTALLELPGLPRCSPHDLSRGAEALAVAREGTLRALDSGLFLLNHK